MTDAESRALDRTPTVIEAIGSSYERRPEIWREVSEAEWESYEWQCAHRLHTVDEISQAIGMDDGERAATEALSRAFSAAIPPHYASLVRTEHGSACPIRRQAVPTMAELEESASLSCDPLGERRHALSRCAVRRYPDRILLYTTHACAMRCRHCTRRSRVGLSEAILREDILRGIEMAQHDERVRDVLISGGDPLSLDNATLEIILSRLRSCAHIDVIRLCTRMVCTQPQRIFDAQLLDILRRYAPIYVNTQFNHPYEATTESAEAMRLLRSSGCILGNQSVLLRGVNDSAQTLEALYRWLTREGCRPYYLFLCDVAQGTEHFRTTLQAGLDIMKYLRGRLSGLALPHFVVDLPDGNGKIDLSPDSILSHEGTCLTFRNWFGDAIQYWEPEY